MAKINVVEKTPGNHLDYSVTSEKITFGDDELTIKLSAKERDEEVTVDICMDKDEGIVMGTGGSARNYAAQVIIPARQYNEEEQTQTGEDGQAVTVMVPVPIPFKMERCTLILWGLEV